MKAFLGIDTSCYTTSAAIVDEDGRLLKENRKALSVDTGKRGLRQSEAVFLHIRNLPTLLADVLLDSNVSAVCASTRPRPQLGSYMPVFQTGESFARAVAAAAGIPFFETSHQEAHLLSAKYFSGLEAKTYLAIHLSGGTTELLLVREEENGMRIERLGGSKDVYAGQLIDRVGTAMGIGFPCGKVLTEMASDAKGSFQIPSAVKDLDCSFSGAETKAYTLQGEKEEIAYAVLDCIVRTIGKMLTAGSAATGLKEALLFGGVAESTFIREKLGARIKKRQNDLQLYYARPSFSADNALGAALAARNLYHRSIT